MSNPSTPLSARSRPSPAPQHNREPLDAFVFPNKPLDTPFVDSPSDVLAPLPSPTSPSKRESPFKRPMRPGHIRAKSMLDSRQQKRLSLNLPVQPLILPTPGQTSWYAGSPLLSPDPLASPTETSFLAKLAAQERRVLELKDELKQAEQELEKLKRHWALEEAQKKKGDVRRVHPLQPLSATLPLLDCLEEDEDGSSEWLQKEMERRKLLMSNIKTSNRKVFSGSRHMRTLSLLSPERGYFPESALPSRNTDDEDLSLQRKRTHSSARSNDDDHHLAEIGCDGSGDDLLQTSKRMAVDLKHGLLTFFDDLRQATVGEEGISATEARITESGHRNSSITRGAPRPQFAPVTERKISGGGSIRRRPASWWGGQPSDPLIDIAASFWRDHGVEPPAQQQQKTKKTPSPPPKIAATRPTVSTPRSDVSDSWAWDTPSKLSDRKSAPKAPASLTDSISSPQSSESGPSTPSDRDDRVRPAASPAASTERTLTPRSSMDALSPHLEALRLQFGGLSDKVAGAPATKKSDKSEAIPWPSLQKLTPTNLRRTASHLMSEWEKSLSPPSTSPAQEKGQAFAGAEVGVMISPSAARIGEETKRKD